MKDQRFIYSGKPFKDVSIKPVTYIEDYFRAEIELESDVFYTLRKKNNILPYRLADSTETELEQIKAFFLKNSSTFFFLFNNSELIGSVLLLNNYIQSLAIAEKYRRKHFGEKLSKFAINYALEKGYERIELKVMDGNMAAQKLYEKIGFRRVEETS